MTGRNEPCWCGSGKKWKKCHYPKSAPLTSHTLAEEYYKRYKIRLKDSQEIEGISRSCQLAASILHATAQEAREGVTTSYLNTFAHKLHLEAGAIPAPLQYGNPPYPKSICTSLNEVICHGIPDEIPLKNGDILNIDVSCILEGFYGDCSLMVVVGSPSAERKLVVDVAQECLHRAIAILKPGVLICEIGEIICDYAESKGCSVVDQFVGHGVGIEFHEAPQIPHHRNHLQIPLVAGMTFTIEPMINAGVTEAVIDTSNHWTARTRDGRASAQWEHTLLITEEGHKILTLAPT